MLKINEFAKQVHKNAIDHGWWEDARPFPEILMLCVSELAEALEEYRKGRPDVYCGKECTKHGNGLCQGSGAIDRGDWVCDTCRLKPDREICTSCQPEGIAIELADCVLRILDYCAYADIDLENALVLKHTYNQGREYRHGGKKC